MLINHILPRLSFIAVRELEETDCRVLSNDTKVRTSLEGLFAYPDLTVVCGEGRYHDAKKNVLLNPTIIFEILSPSTAHDDRGSKSL